MRRICLLVVMILLIGCESKSNVATVDINENEVIKMNEKVNFTDQNLDHYSIKANLVPEDSIITATETIIYTNREGVDLDQLYLHTYPNAFSMQNQPSLLDDPTGTNSRHGALEISSVMINSTPALFQSGPTSTSIEIPYKLLKGETYTIELLFTVKVPNIVARFGVKNSIYNICNW